MRYILALGGALALASCASGERVTLLAPVQAEKIENNDVGAVVVRHGDEETVVDSANLQASLRGDRPPRLRQLAETDPGHAELMSTLPREQTAVSIEFAEGQSTLTADQVRGLRDWVAGDGERPGREIVIRAYADSVGQEDDNLRLSEQRAAAVANQLRAEGIKITPSDAVGMGEFAAKAETGDEVSSPKWRRVDVVVR
ncbi:MAG: OmpA family protein [Erythrobacter sp.]